MQDYLQFLKLSLLNIGFDQLDHKWDFDNVISPFSRMYYITSGEAKVYHNDEVFYLKPNHMYLIPSHTYSRYKCDLYHEQYYISFLEEVANGLSIYSFKKFIYEIKATERELTYFKRLLEINPGRTLVNNDPKIYDNKPTLYNFKIKNDSLNSSKYLESQGILSVLFSKFIEDFSQKEKVFTKSNIEKAFVYISENLHTKLTVEDLAAYCNLNKDHFSRSFNQNFGMRPIKYIQSRRIQRAQLLLLTTSDSLKVIAEKVGIENMSYFIRTFKKFTGKTPNEFRQEQPEV
jgi:AraC-like DNA-binding protein